MSRVIALALRELRSQIVSPVAWTVGAGFLLVAGFFFFNLVSSFNAAFEAYFRYAQAYRDPSLLEQLNLNDLVISQFFGNLLILLVFIVPILTMRAFAGERRRGSDELLLTAPITPGQIVTGKFIGVAALTTTIVLASVVYVLILLRYGNPEIGPVWTGLLGVLLVSVSLCALGLAVSASTGSQVAAGVGSFVLFLMLFIVHWPADQIGGRVADVLRAVSLPMHFANFGSGVVTSVDVVYFVSLTALGLFAARVLVASRRWR